MDIKKEIKTATEEREKLAQNYRTLEQQKNKLTQEIVKLDGFIEGLQKMSKGKEEEKPKK